MSLRRGKNGKDRFFDLHNMLTLCMIKDVIIHKTHGSGQGAQRAEKGIAMTETNSRERHIEIRWVGDEKTEAALLRCLELDALGQIAPGDCKRWISVPVRKSSAALKALAASGARVLDPTP